MEKDTAPDSFLKRRASNQKLLKSSMTSNKKMFQCFEVKLTYKLAQQSKRRTVWSVNIQCDEACKEELIIGVSFGPESNVDYNQAFDYLLFAENSDLRR